MRSLALALLLTCGACTDRVQFADGTSHECVGVTEDREPTVHYAVDKGNVVVGVLLAETIVVPIVVALDQVWCPVDTARVPPVTPEANDAQK